jgi:hypothetical protein
MTVPGGEREMDDLLIFSASAAIAVLILALPARDSRWWRLAAVPVWMFALGMALRICGRTYPGIHYPDSELLNHVFNGNRLFTWYGYNMVLALGLADAAFVFLSRFGSGETPHNIVRALTAVRAALLALILLIIGYGFLIAVELGRFPGFEDEWELATAPGSACSIEEERCYELLRRESAAGNWKAGQRLGHHRAMTSGWRDRETLGHVRLWFEHNPVGAAIALSAMLADSCERADREEALQIFQKYVMPTRPPGNPGMVEIRDRLKANVDGGVPKCVNYQAG